MPNRYSPLGEQLEKAYVTAVADWHRSNRRGMDMEVALTSTIKRVHLEVQLRPARLGLLLVTFVGRRQQDQDVYPFELQSTPFSALMNNPLM
jgi:hypothetical protein